MNDRASSWPIAFLLGFALAAAGPAIARKPVKAIQAQQEIPEEQLLDVGIRIFDPGLPEEDEDALEAEGIFAEVRKSESRFIPFHLKNTLEGTGHWGAVRVVPAGVENVDVLVIGEILSSHGMKLVLHVRVQDATGREWLDKRYKQDADPLAYMENRVEVRDPYQIIYNRLANDLLEAREKLDDDETAELRWTTRLRFAADLAPTPFAEYLETNKKGRWFIERLPTEDDPMLRRVDEIRLRDYVFIDTLNEYYADFYERMDEPYDNWRSYSYEEQLALQQIRREARMKKIFGAILVAVGMAADGGLAADGAVVGGSLLITEGIGQGKEAKIHRAALRELAESFDADIAPLVVEIQGRTMRLTGSAEAQYASWRELLQEIFATETGLPVDPNLDSPATTAGTTSD